eukprot:SAG11_NODE_712_length_7637_cov_13.877554_2_plen_842_part_01
MYETDLGNNYYHYVWTTGWELNITIPTEVTPEISTLTLRFSSTGGSASEVAVDNVIVDGAVCGTLKSCVCTEVGYDYASKAIDTANDDAQITMAETVSSAAPGYLDYMEITCAHCVVMGAVGAVYPRWGSSTCPEGHATMYNGYMVGSQSGSSGGGSNYMCLSSRIGLDQYDWTSHSGADVYRAEYYFHSSGTPLSSLSSLAHFDAVCSMCQTPGRPWSLMIPGTDSCPNGSELDYSGYVMSEKHSHWRMEFICVDDTVEGVYGSDGDATSAGLYPATTSDGFGSAGGYVDHREVACVQCSASGGPLYVRWGRSSCPASADLMYSGLVAGSDYRHNGGGYNYLCMHETAPERTECGDEELSCESVTIELSVGVDVRSMSLTQVNNIVYSPRDFKLLGSNDGVAWTTILTATDFSFDSNGQTKSIARDGDDSAGSFEMIRLIVTRTHYVDMVCYDELTLYDADGEIVWADVGIDDDNRADQFTDTGISGSYSSANLPGDAGSYYCSESGGFAVPDMVGRLHRAEYVTTRLALWRLWYLHDEDVPCAVCQSPGSISVFMQPGNRVCPSGWTPEYEGYIMSSPINTRRGEYVCVDEEAEAAAASDPNRNTYASQMSPVEQVLEKGAMLPAQVQFGELVCVVCSRPDPSITCPSISVTDDVTMECTNGESYASNCAFSCPRGRVLSGPETVACTVGGTWSSDTSSITCIDPSPTTPDVYVRWGAETCDVLDTRLYLGRAVGARMHDYGSGSNHLCVASGSEGSAGGDYVPCTPTEQRYNCGGYQHWLHFGTVSSYAECERIVRQERPDANGFTTYNARYYGTSLACFADFGATTQCHSWPYASCIF